MIRRKVAEFREQLPDNVIFNLSNLRALLRDDNAAFIYINFNLLIHSVIVVVHCPTMFWTTDPERACLITLDCPQTELAWSVREQI